MGWINPTDSDEIIEKPRNTEAVIKSKKAEITRKRVKSDKSDKSAYEIKNDKDQNDRKSVLGLHFLYF